VTWAQRTGTVLFTLGLPDVQDASVTLSATKLSFSGKSNGKAYASELEFFAPLDEKAAESKYEVKPRGVTFHIQKAEESWWPRLLADKSKEKNQVSIDWSKFKDEDEAEGGFGAAETGFGGGAQGFGGGEDEDDGGMGGMGGMMGGMGGMGGMMGGGGAGGMDMAKLMAMMGKQGGGAGGMGGMNFGGGEGGEGDDADEDDEGEGEGGDGGDLPDLAPEPPAEGPA
jgi:hypothetical protein